MYSLYEKHLKFNVLNFKAVFSSKATLTRRDIIKSTCSHQKQHDCIMQLDYIQTIFNQLEMPVSFL